jgi:hypothetical protein
MQVCPDIGGQLLSMLIQSMQRPADQKDYILAMTGVFVSTLSHSFPSSLLFTSRRSRRLQRVSSSAPHETVCIALPKRSRLTPFRSGQHTLAEFLMGHLIVYARNSRNMQLTELCLNLADNLGCDREVSRTLSGTLCLSSYLS